MILFLGKVSASEFTLSLSEKVLKSDLVAIVRVKDVAPKDSNRVEMTFTLELGEIIKGASKTKSVTLKQFSRHATAGFCGAWIEKEKLFLAYLKMKEDGTYGLAGDSNQYFEDITEKKILVVRDIGQTMNTVELESKVLKLREIVEKSKKAEQAVPPKSDRAGG